MDTAPTTRRKLGPTTSLPSSTAEEQAKRHGIPDEISQALQGNVGMRIRQAVGAGRENTFGRTQSHPVLPFNHAPGSAFGHTLNGGSNMYQHNAAGGFATTTQIMKEAQSIISKEDLRRRELRPYGSGDSMEVSALDLAGGSGGRSGASRGSPEQGGRRFRFGKDGEVVMEGEAAPRPAVTGGLQPVGDMIQGRKRSAEGEEDEGGDTDVDETGTEVDEDELPPLQHDGSGSTTASGFDEFPAVFASPDISHPALFGSAQLPSRFGTGSMLPPPVPAGPGRRGLAGQGPGRQMKALPGRALGKTMSAPVRFGGGMDIDSADGEDGFDVAEWAGKTDF